MSSSRLSRRLVPLLVLCTLAAGPASAVNKDMVQLQTQVQQLIDAVARLQQSSDVRAGVLKDLIQQTVDSVNKMSITVNGMQLKLQNQGDAQSTRNDQLSGQVQALNDSLDELKARMQRMEKSLGDLQSQVQSTNAILGSLPGAGGGAGAGAPMPSTSMPSTPPPANAPGAGTAGPPPGNATDLSPTRPAASSGPSANEMYRAAYSDYMAGKYPLASSEFADVIKAYPDDNLSGNAYFYTGEINARASKPTAAIKNFDEVLERYPDNAKIPAAHLHKGEALIATKQTEAGVRELKALIARFPNSPEAAQARTRLSALGASARR